MFCSALIIGMFPRGYLLLYIKCMIYTEEFCRQCRKI